MDEMCVEDMEERDVTARVSDERWEKREKKNVETTKLLKSNIFVFEK